MSQVIVNLLEMAYSKYSDSFARIAHGAKGIAHILTKDSSVQHAVTRAASDTSVAASILSQFKTIVDNPQAADRDYRLACHLFTLSSVSRSVALEAVEHVLKSQDSSLWLTYAMIRQVVQFDHFRSENTIKAAAFWPEQTGFTWGNMSVPPRGSEGVEDEDRVVKNARNHCLTSSTG